MSSVAIRVHDLDSMVAFYSLAFDTQFHEVHTFGIPSQFGDIGGVTLKFVPIRDAPDFEEFPIHQLGFHVPDAEAIVRIVQQYGGRPEGDIRRDGKKIHAAIRDPDGNTVELYSEV